MASDRSLQFDIEAIDKAGKAFESVALRLDKLGAKLDRLDHKRVNVDVDADTSGAEANIKRFESSLSKAGSNLPSFLDPKVVTAAAAAFVVAMPLVGAAAAAAFTVAFGAGLSGLGILIASKNKGVQKRYEKLGDHVGKVFGKAALPFEHALMRIAPILGRMADKLAPVFKSIGDVLGPALVGFARQLSQAFTNPAFTAGVKAMATAFANVLRSLGPQLPGLFKSIGEALSDLGDTVSHNSDLIAGMITFLFKVVYVVTRIVDGLTIMYSYVVTHIPQLAGIFLHVFDMILGGAVKAFDWIPGLGPKLDSAYAKFHSWATKTTEALNDIPRIHKIKGDITDLQTKLAAAKQSLKDPTLTKAQKKEIKGDIKDLQHKLANARAALFQMTHKKYTITVRGSVYFARPPGFIGPVIPHATGGPTVPGRTYLVGEKGPELLTMGAGGNGFVTPNGETKAALSGLSDGSKDRPNIDVRVFIGNQEISGIVRTEIEARDTAGKGRILAGTGRVV